MDGNGSILSDMDNYDLTDELRSPEPKRKADDKAIAANYGEGSQYSVAVAGDQVQIMPKKSPSKRPEPVEGYIYGFILPFEVDNKDYCVVKIGRTAAGQLIRRLRDHQKGFSNTTQVPIFHELPLSANQNEETFINNSLKWKDQKVFLVSYIKEGLNMAEDEAGLSIGVAPFTGNTFKAVFSEGRPRDVTTTEWFVARRKVIDDIQVDFWHNKLDSFDTADDFVRRLKELNKRKHIELKITLETLANQIYASELIKVPVYEKEASDLI